MTTAVRHHQHYYGSSKDLPREPIDGYQTMPETPSTYSGSTLGAHSRQSSFDTQSGFTQSTSHSDYEYSFQGLSSTQDDSQELPKPLTTRESVELFQETVDAARRSIKQSLAGSEKAGETLRPKLTVDLSRRNLGQIPSEVITIIKQDVERLHVAHNQLRYISIDFATCSALKYLNLRDNHFREVPKAIFGLPQLEILDLSRNRLSEIPDEIEKIKALRVFSIHHNDIENLPCGLGNISTLRMLKLAGNPLNSQLRDLIEGNENPLSPETPALPNDENEKDKILTTRVIDYLRTQASMQALDFGDNPLETPRAQSRFPVHPNDYGYNTSGSESTSAPRSPNFTRSAVTPRSHYRMPSNQISSLQNGQIRRPSLAPLSLNNERNRSNSEGILQVTQNTKNKRMGMLQKRNVDMNVLDDARGNRNSLHYRGQSHSSALRNSIRPGDQHSTNAHSPNGTQNGTFVRRLSSVPEQKQKSTCNDNVVEGAKGILYSLHLLHPHLSSLMTLVKEGKSKRESLERIHYQAAVQLEYLDQSLHDYNNAVNKGKNIMIHAKRTVYRATHACLSVYEQIALILLRNVKQLVADGDPRYIRTLMLLLYGGWNEARNARRILVSHSQARAQPNQSQQDTVQSIPAANHVALEEAPSIRDGSMTPTPDQPKPVSRWRSGSIVQPSSSQINLKATLVDHIPIPTYSNPPSRSSSRSHSRAGTFQSSASTMIGTPRSGESFNLNSAVFNPRSRSGSINTAPERSQQSRTEQDLFEKIYFTLNVSAEQGLQVINYLEPRFQNSLRIARNSYQVDQMICSLWSSIIGRTHLCLETTKSLKQRLSTIKLNDPEARNSPSLWRLAKKFVNAYSNLLISLREARTLNLVESDVRHKLRPVHKITVDAANLMNASPWNRLTSETSNPPSQNHSRAPTPVQNGYPLITAQLPPAPPTILQPYNSSHQNGYPNYTHRRTNGSNGSVTSVASPYTPSVPATPLSAALGPAAQATVPSTTPPSAGMAGVFEGNVFQRADSFLNMQQTIQHSVLLRRQGTGPP